LLTKSKRKGSERRTSKKTTRREETAQNWMRGEGRETCHFTRRFLELQTLQNKRAGPTSATNGKKTKKSRGALEREIREDGEYRKKGRTVSRVVRKGRLHSSGVSLNRTWSSGTTQVLAPARPEKKT